MTNENEPGSSKSARDSVEGSLKFRMIILLALMVFKLVLVIQLIVRDGANPAWLLVGVAAGIAVGLIARRMHIISWDQSAKTVVSQIDAVGIIVLILYLLYTFFGDDLVEMGIKNVTAAGLVVTSMAATVALVRLRSTYRSVADILRDAGLMPE